MRKNENKRNLIIKRDNALKEKKKKWKNEKERRIIKNGIEFFQSKKKMRAKIKKERKKERMNE